MRPSHFNKQSPNAAQVKPPFFGGTRKFTKSGIILRKRLNMSFDAHFKEKSFGAKTKDV